jgi:hypothetical protein
MAEHMIAETTLLSTTTCASCGIRFAMPKDFRDKLLQTGERFYCPNGHALSFDSELEKLRNELQRERQKHDQTQAALRTAQEAAAKLELRLKHGVCPCCRRTFSNVQEHMRTQHPEYGPRPLNMPKPPPVKGRKRK